MYDDFLHRIRVEPPPNFLARLKSRLDLQPPPTKPAPSLRLKLALGVLLTGSVFAITLMFLNHGESDTTASPEAKLAPSSAPAKDAPVKTTHPNATTPTPGAHVAEGKPTTPIPGFYAVTTVKSLGPYLSYLMRDYFKAAGRDATPMAAGSAAEAFAQYCGSRLPAKAEQPQPTLVLSTRAMTQSEADKCQRNMVDTSSIAVGFQAMVLVRSKLYGPLNLTPTDLFLALAAQVPDPAHPDKLIPNPNAMWSDVNGALEREPIEVIGPSGSSVTGLAFREIILEAGCRALPSLATVKQCPDLRSDGVYTEMSGAGDILQELQTKPNAIGVIPYGIDTRYATTIAIGPLAGVVPNFQSISSGTYPGSRSLYLYGSGGAWGQQRSYIATTLKYFGGELSVRFGIIPPDWSPP